MGSNRRAHLPRVAFDELELQARAQQQRLGAGVNRRGGRGERHRVARALGDDRVDARLDRAELLLVAHVPARAAASRHLRRERGADELLGAAPPAPPAPCARAGAAALTGLQLPTSGHGNRVTAGTRDL